MGPLDALQKACGDDGVRPARPDDVVAGVPVSYVAAPRSTDQVAEVLRTAAEHGLTVVPRGNGTKLDWGAPPQSADVLLDLSRMDSVLEHAAGDLVVRVEPGVRLAGLQDALRAAGQRLAIDEVVPGSTIGGVVATGLCGPSRMLYGGVRDLLIGVTVVLADGTVTRSGGKVVKNVAGYDLPKLYAGSYGTLGVVTETIFRLHPLPDERSFVSVTVDDDALGARLAAVVGSQLVPTALEVDRPAPDGPVTVTVLLEGAGVPHRAASAAELLGGSMSPEPPEGWGAYVSGDVVIKLTAEISGVARLLAAIGAAAGHHGLGPSVRGSAGAGVLYVNLDRPEPASVAGLLADLRAAAAAVGGSAVVLRAPEQVRSAVEVWGPVNGLELMRRVKEQFDPERRLSPGRFVGGI